MQRAVVIAAHRAPDRPSIRVAAGDAVSLGERGSDWPQFVWATLAQGLGGWMTSAARCCEAPPAALFDRDTGPATALQDYDTRELSTDIGEVVTLHYPQEDWWWAESSSGDSGWIPARALEFIDENPTSSL